MEPRLYAVDGRPDFMELGPQSVTAKLVRALEARRPSPRYFVTVPTYMVWWMKRLLPTRMLDGILMRG